MSRVYITGDTHSDFSRFTSENFSEGKNLNRDDYVIICGDFGGLWDFRGESKTEKYWLDRLDSKPWTTLFADGNHENFDRLNAYGIEEWNGGGVHKIRDNVIHLMRGEIFDIAGSRFFCFGGGQSHDIKDGILNPEDENFERDYYIMSHTPGCQFRVNGCSWWKEELPDAEEIQNARNNLKKANYEVDYIISHEPDTETLMFLGGGLYKPDIISGFLSEVKQTVRFRQHYCGHMHINEDIPMTKTTLLYNGIMRIF